MKLAIVIPGFQSSPQDWCIPAFTNLARELARNAEVHVFALRYPHRRSAYLIGDVLVHALGGGAIGGRRYPGLSLLKLWRDTRQAVKVEHTNAPFDAIIGIWATESGWLATRIGRELKVPTLVHIAGGELTWLPQIRYGNRGRGLSGWMVRQSLKRADLVTVPSIPIGRLVARHAPDPKRVVFHWALGVDTTMFAPNPSAPQPSCRPFTFVAVGSLLPVKDYELLIRGFAQFHSGLAKDERSIVCLSIVGSGPLREKLGNLVRQLGLEGYVNFLGDVSHDALPQIYREADCFVSGAWHEAQCMAALEAMSCGLPWIGPPVGALPDVFGGPRSPSGHLVHKRTPAAFAEAMSGIYRLSKEERLAMGSNARQTILAEYELKQQTAMLLYLLNSSRNPKKRSEIR